MRVSIKKLLLWAGAFWLIAVLLLVVAIVYAGTVDQAAPSDVMVVLGAGITRDGRPGWALQRRATHAADLWQQGYAPIVICSGGQAPGYPRAEAEACRDVLVRYGVPVDAIVLEKQSRSTEENALYSRAIMQERGWQTALVVSDGYHVLRAAYLFDRYGIQAVTSPVAHSQVRMTHLLVSSVLREVLAFHWQVFKDTLRLPVTHVP
jgi:uncharacterized SAM-binding protein YcdF (DUF218 family)